jgi:hypothetical protein
VIKLQAYKNTMITLSISEWELQLLECDKDIPSFAKNIAESSELYLKHNTSITTSIYNGLKAISSVYISMQTEEIHSFLLENKDLISTLLEAQVQIESLFGDVPLYLELHSDFENPDWTKLFLIIKNNLPNSVALVQLEDLLKNWYFHKEKKIRNLLTISEESQ